MSSNLWHFSLCSADCLNSSLVKGKIVACDSGGVEDEVKRAGAIGAILNSSLRDDTSFVFSLPAVVPSGEKYSALPNYLNSSRYDLSKEASLRDLFASNFLNFHDII